MLVTYMKSDFRGTDAHRVVANVATAGDQGTHPPLTLAWQHGKFPFSFN